MPILGVLDKNVDVSRLAVCTPKPKALLRSSRPLSTFANKASTSPSLTRGTLEDWEAFCNNNVSYDRLIDRIKN